LLKERPEKKELKSLGRKGLTVVNEKQRDEREAKDVTDGSSCPQMDKRFHEEYNGGSLLVPCREPLHCMLCLEVQSRKTSLSPGMGYVKGRQTA
jgi:hypothetical protein